MKRTAKSANAVIQRAAIEKRDRVHEIEAEAGRRKIRSRKNLAEEGATLLRLSSKDRKLILLVNLVLMMSEVDLVANLAENQRKREVEIGREIVRAKGKRRTGHGNR